MRLWKIEALSVLDGSPPGILKGSFLAWLRTHSPGPLADAARWRED